MKHKISITQNNELKYYAYTKKKENDYIPVFLTQTVIKQNIRNNKEIKCG